MQNRRTVLAFFGVGGACVFAVLFFLGRSWTSNLFLLKKHFAVLVAGGLVFGWVAWKALAGVPRSRRSFTAVLAEPSLSRWDIGVFLLVSSMVLFRSVAFLGDSLEWDEYNLGSALWRETFWEVINPLKSSGALNSNTNQTMTNLASFFSVQAFGLSEWALRLPAFFFTLMFLFFLWRFVRKTVSRFTFAVLCFHLLVNNTFGWYSHSAKGYISLMAFSLPIVGAFLALRKGEEVSSPSVLTFTGVMLLCHSFGLLFALLMFFALLLALACSQVALPAETNSRKLAYGFFILCPVICVLAVFHFVVMFGHHNLFHLADSTTFVVAFKNVLGYSQRSFWPLATLTVFASGIAGFRALKKCPVDLLQVVFFILIAGLAVAIFALEPNIFCGRWLLVFLIPFIVWACESAAEIREKKWRRMAKVTASLCFCVFPILGMEQATEAHRCLASYYRFKNLLLEKARLEPGSCFSFSGDGYHQERWTRTFYFMRQATLNPCKANYHASFGKDLSGAGRDFHSDLPANARLFVVYNDGSRTLYRWEANRNAK